MFSWNKHQDLHNSHEREADKKGLKPYMHLSVSGKITPFLKINLSSDLFHCSLSTHVFLARTNKHGAGFRGVLSTREPINFAVVEALLPAP